MRADQLGGAAPSWRRARRVELRHCLTAAALLAALGPAPAPAAPPPAATSSAQARADAVRCLPLDQLDGRNRARVEWVLAHTSLYRRLAVQVTDCDPQMYRLLVRNPDLVVNIWRVLGISKIDLRRVGDNLFQADDHDGTTGLLKCCYQSDDRHLFYGEGQYQGPLLEQPLKVRCVVLLKSGDREETNRRYYVTSRIDAWVTMENVGLELLAKTFQPLVTRAADYNFREAAAFVGDVSRSAETNPQRLLRLSPKLTRISPELREEFDAAIVQVADDAAGRQAAAPRPGPSLFNAGRRTVAVPRR